MQYYRHYKGNYYRVIGEARHSETLEPMVVYQAMYRHRIDGQGVEPAPEGGEIWVRPKEMFYEMFTLSDGRQVARFAPVSESEYRDSLQQTLIEAQILRDKMPELMAYFREKGYTAEDFYGGCSLCGDANEFALDIIDGRLKQTYPDMADSARDQYVNTLYRALHKQFESEESTL